MLKRLKTVSMMLFLMGASTGAAYAASPAGVDDVKITQQSGTCTGVVLDAAGETVIGASVVVKGTTNGTITGMDGDFTISGVKKGDIIEISFVGYQTVEVVWDGKPINVTLKDDTQQLQEVVITAVGLPKQAKSVGYATTRVSTQEIERANAVNPVNALQGKVAGVQINQGGASGVTSSSSITIRGAKSVDKNNSPIWVIDGMIIQEAVTGNLNGTDWGSQLKNLNPADYESVQVLKGAAATALFGSRGANGAIVITSKGGKFGKQGIGVELNQTVEFTDIYDSPVDLQNTFGMGSISNGYQGDFTPDGDLLGTGNSWGPKMDGRMVNMYMPGGQKVPFVAHPDNWKDFYRTGVNSTTNVAVSGGGENSSFRLSYGYTSNKGVFVRNDFNRHNIAFRGNTKLNDIFSVEMGLKLGFSKALNGGRQGGWDWTNNVGMMTTYYLPRNFDVNAYERTYRDPETQAVESDSRWSTPRAYFHNRDTEVKQRKEQSILADLKLTAKITDWLTASVKGNYNFYGYSHMDRWQGTGANGGPANSGGYGRSGERSGSYNVQGMLNFAEQSFKLWDQDFTIGGLIAAEVYGNTEKHSWAKSTNGGLVIPGVFSFSNSRNKIEPTFSYTPRNEQVFGISAILNLGWKDQLFLELTGRNDWLSTLTYPTYVADGQNNYSVFYPSANASWVFTDTFREKMPEWFSFGKLRASIARVGMGTSAYATVKGYGIYNQKSIYTPDRSDVQSATPNLGTAYNNNVKPEIQQQIEFGFDTRFFNERLSIDFAYYKANTYNQIMSVGSVSESGASSKLINAGNIQNQGIELMVEGTPIRTADWRWTIGGNFSLNRGKVVELDDEVKEWNLMGEYDGAPAIWAYEGGEFGVLTSSLNSPYNSPVWYFEGEKGDPRNGKMMINYAGEGGKSDLSVYYVQSLYDRNQGDDRTKRHILGKVEPDFTLSLNTSLSYKNFDLYIQGDGRFGGNYFSNMWKYAIPCGSLKSTLRGRSKELGGIARINYKGETVYDAIKLDAVFVDGATAPLQNPDGTKGEMVEVGGMTYMDAIAGKPEWGGLGIRPMSTAAYYSYNFGWGAISMPGSIQDNTWFALREITLGYRFPESICKKFGANYLRLGFTARNICYIINELTDGLNPASISNNNPLQPMDIGAVPFSRTYAVNLTVRF